MMSKFISASAVAFGMAAVGPAYAFDLRIGGMGRVLTYPHYTVNAGQRTRVSVLNTAHICRAVKMHFREARNGRALMDFNLHSCARHLDGKGVGSLSCRLEQ